MINGAALRINSKPPPQNPVAYSPIQLPMLGSLAASNKPPLGQQQQQQAMNMSGMGFNPLHAMNQNQLQQVQLQLMQMELARMQVWRDPGA